MNEIKSFYETLKDYRKEQPQLKVCVSNREESSRKQQKPTQMVSGKFEYIKQRALAVLDSEASPMKFAAASTSRANCY